jgi:hypothetical protein
MLTLKVEAGEYALDGRWAGLRLMSSLRSPPQNMSPSMSQKNAPFLGAERTSSNGRSDWPSQYGGTASSEEEHSESSPGEPA